MPCKDHGVVASTVAKAKAKAAKRQKVAKVVVDAVQAEQLPQQPHVAGVGVHQRAVAAHAAGAEVHQVVAAHAAGAGTQRRRLCQAEVDDDQEVDEDHVQHLQLQCAAAGMLVAEADKEVDDAQDHRHRPAEDDKVVDDDQAPQALSLGMLPGGSVSKKFLKSAPRNDHPVEDDQEVADARDHRHHPAEDDQVVDDAQCQCAADVMLVVEADQVVDDVQCRCRSQCGAADTSDEEPVDDGKTSLKPIPAELGGQPSSGSLLMTILSLSLSTAGDVTT